VDASTYFEQDRKPLEFMKWDAERLGVIL
jgi:hypothetical protein